MDNTVVETRSGTLRGMDLGPVLAWKGIPYAAPPVGALRFQPPQPPEVWTGVREATICGPISLQLPFVLANGSLEVTMPEQQSEDCLYLNIWAPPPDGKARPVMVWLHGGSLLNGSGSQADYDGADFAEQGDLVLVTLNYRLGVLGFLYLAQLGGEAYASSGNCGLLDQVAALQWVHDNIAAFGGDPTQVTVFGESAGAISIALLLAMPAARGLFQRAILESGPVGIVPTPEEASQKARKFLGLLGLEDGDLATLQNLPTEKILAAQARLIKDGRLGSIQPVLDGKDVVETPLQALARGSARELALLIGTNRDEVRLFTDTITGEKRPSALGSASLPPEQKKRLPKILRTYSQSQFLLWLSLARVALKRPDERFQDLVLEIVTDFAVLIPSIRMAERQAEQGGRVWMYRFDWPSPLLKFGACHALELPFVWNKLESSPIFHVLLGANPPRALARQMQAAWIAFARSGDPNTAGLPAWPAYEVTRRSTMIFNQACHVLDDPQSARRAIWDGLL